MLIVFKDVLDRVVEKISVFLTNSWGQLIVLLGFLVSFFSPVQYAFVAVGVAILIDLMFGVFSAIKQGKTVLSVVMRENTFAKVMIYFCPLALVFVLERVFVEDTFYFTKLGCVIAGGCELWSMLASALIIAPGLLFPKILRLQLRGEIESKLGKNVSNLLDKEVDNDKVTKGIAE